MLPMSGDQGESDELDGLRREVVALRSRVAELQRAAARHEDTDGHLVGRARGAAARGGARRAPRYVDLGSRQRPRDLVRRAVPHPRSRAWQRHAVGGDLLRDRSSRGPRARSQATSRTVHSRRRPAARRLSRRAPRRLDPSHDASSSSMLFDAEGTVRRIVGGVLDRTESLEVETKLRRTLGAARGGAALRAARELALRSAAAASSSGRKSSAASRGCPPDVAPERRALPRARGARRPGALSGEPRATDRTHARTAEIDGRLQRPDGELRHVRLTGFSVVGADGSVRSCAAPCWM